MAAPVRQFPIDYDKAVAPRWEANNGSCVFTRRVYFSQFAAAALTGDLDMGGFGPGPIAVEGAWLILNTPFSGGAAATATMSAGTTGSPALYMAATDVFTTNAATPTAPKVNVGLTLVPGTMLATAATPLATATIRLRLTTTVGNTNVLTAGVADFYVRLRPVTYRAK
jgi:hypothetical protein